MKFNIDIRMCLLLLLVTGQAALAQSRSTGGGGASGFYFEETFFPVYVNRNDTRSVTTAPGVATESGLGYDFRTTIGYVAWGQALFALSYNHYALTTKRPYVSGGDSSLDETTTRGEFGPTLGYLSGGFRVLATFFLTGAQTVNTKNADNTGVTGDVSIKNSDMSGFQITAGYAFPLFTATEIGPSLVYRSVTFKKQSKENRLNSFENYSGAPLYSKAVDASLSAMVSVIVRY